MMNSDDDPFLKLHNWSIILQKHWPAKDWCFWHSQISEDVFFIYFGGLQAVMQQQQTKEGGGTVELFDIQWWLSHWITSVFLSDD